MLQTNPLRYTETSLDHNANFPFRGSHPNGGAHNKVGDVAESFVSYADCRIVTLLLYAANHAIDVLQSTDNTIWLTEEN